MSDRLNQFNSSVARVTDDRGKVYGDPREDFARIAYFWSGLFGVQVHPWQVAQAMILLKTSRLMHSPDHLDSLIDQAGYARTAVMVTDP
jgi:hypothetical protein